MEAAVENVTDCLFCCCGSGSVLGCRLLLAATSGRLWEVECVEVVIPVGSGGCFLRQQMTLQKVAPMLVEKRQ